MFPVASMNRPLGLKPSTPGALVSAAAFDSDDGAGTADAILAVGSFMLP